jgi:branched-subunit amino acid transport protein
MNEALPLAIIAVAAGVLLPKALPAALPSERPLFGRLRHWFDLLPPAILAALTTVTMLGGHPPHTTSRAVIIGGLLGLALGSVRRFRALRRGGKPSLRSLLPVSPLESFRQPPRDRR